MKPHLHKPSRTLGIFFVILIVVALISGLAPAAGARDSSEDLVLKWETSTWETSINVADIYGVGTY